MTKNVPHIQADLMNQIAVGDKAALEQLYRVLSPRLYGIILRMVRRRDWAEEILHDTFIHIWQSANYYDDKRSEPHIWLSHIARNRAIDFLRKHENRSCSVDDISEAEAGFRHHFLPMQVMRRRVAFSTVWRTYPQNSDKAFRSPIIVASHRVRLRSQ